MKLGFSSLFILIVFTVAILIKIFRGNSRKEHFGSLMQLYAKGPQDYHLTVGNEKYVWPFTRWLWNNPTRNQPLYYYYDYNNYYLWPYFYW